MRMPTSPPADPAAHARSLREAAAAALSVDPVAARGYAEQALRLAPDDATALHHYAESLARLGDLDRALALFRQALGRDGSLGALVEAAPGDGPAPVWLDRGGATACPICGEEPAAPLWVGNLSARHPLGGTMDPIRRWVLCKSCHLARVESPPSEAAGAAWREWVGPTLPVPTPDRFSTWVAADDRLVMRLREEGYGEGWMDRSTSIPPRPSMLHVGCGWGSLLAAAAWRGFLATGLEGEPVQAAWARRATGAPILAGGDAHDLPAGVHDIVAVGEALGFVEDPVDLLRAAANALAPDGLFVVSTNGLDHPIQRLEGYDAAPWREPLRRTWFDRESLSAALFRAGLHPTGSFLDEVRSGVVHMLARAAPLD